MKQLKVLARVLVTHEDKILLVRNKGAKYWYPPGGGWEYDHETIKECAGREVLEETGYIVDINELLWLQEFHDSDTKIFFETFWHASIAKNNQQTISGLSDHIDHDVNGAVEEARWFTMDELRDKKVFPERVKSFNKVVGNTASKELDPFIGTFL